MVIMGRTLCACVLGVSCMVPLAVEYAPAYVAAGALGATVCWCVALVL